MSVYYLRWIFIIGHQKKTHTLFEWSRNVCHALTHNSFNKSKIWLRKKREKKCMTISNSPVEIPRTKIIYLVICYLITCTKRTRIRICRKFDANILCVCVIKRCMLIRILSELMTKWINGYTTFQIYSINSIIYKLVAFILHLDKWLWRR